MNSLEQLLWWAYQQIDRFHSTVFFDLLPGWEWRPRGRQKQRPALGYVTAINRKTRTVTISVSPK